MQGKTSRPSSRSSRRTPVDQLGECLALRMAVAVSGMLGHPVSAEGICPSNHRAVKEWEGIALEEDVIRNPFSHNTYWDSRKPP